MPRGGRSTRLPRSSAAAVTDVRLSVGLPQRRTRRVRPSSSIASAMSSAAVSRIPVAASLRTSSRAPGMVRAMASPWRTPCPSGSPSAPGVRAGRAVPDAGGDLARRDGVVAEKLRAGGGELRHCVAVGPVGHRIRQEPPGRPGGRGDGVRPGDAVSCQPDHTPRLWKGSLTDAEPVRVASRPRRGRCRALEGTPPSPRSGHPPPDQACRR